MSVQIERLGMVIGGVEHRPKVAPKWIQKEFRANRICKVCNVKWPCSAVKVEALMRAVVNARKDRDSWIETAGEISDRDSRKFGQIEELEAGIVERDAYIHCLETNCDPAGMVRENALMRDTLKALDAEKAENE